MEAPSEASRPAGPVIQTSDLVEVYREGGTRSVRDRIMM
jgi:hypothetical protein